MQAQELAGLAREALRRCARAYSGAGSAALVDAVLGDAFVQDMLDDIAAPEQQSGGLGGAAARVAAASEALAAVSGCVPLFPRPRLFCLD
jgi:hypothetical protein